jgi:hypothetical protein
MRAALAVVAATLAALLAVIGPPRLIGTGCDSWPSVKLAREESDFLQPCRVIRRLPWATE